MLKAAVAIATVIAAPATAAGYYDNPIVAAFRDQPCGTIIAAIDNPKATKPGDNLDGAINRAADGLARMTAYFGFIVGFDTAKGGLQGDDETTLVRLRKACAADPKATALELLNGF